MFKTTKSKILCVIIICSICILVTLGLIIYKNIEINNEIIEENIVAEEQKNKEKQGINLNGTYNQNDLEIQEKKITREKVEINYLQIYGLKDKIIQDEINKDLEIYALNFYKEKIKDLDEVINISVNMTNTGNFANVISFELSYWSKKDDNAEGFYQDFKGINYDLITGNEICVEDLFTSDAPIEDILRKSVYNSLIKNNLEETLSGDFKVADYGDIEGEISTFINKYKNGKINNFYFSPKKITIYYDENINIEIEMKEYADYISIYNKYLTENSIFETNSVGLKNLYTISERLEYDYRYTNYDKGSNYFIDINIDNIDGDENEFSKKLFQDKIQSIEEEIKKIKSISSKDSSKYYILNYYICISTIKENSLQQDLTYCDITGNTYEVTVHDFEESIEPIIIKENRRDLVGGIPDYLYDFSEVLKIEPQTTKEYYNPETGDKIVI